MSSIISFSQLGLADNLLMSLTELGYETPTPVQAESIPVLLAGQDLLAQAQTGTGKTAAFALPGLSSIDLSLNQPQVLVLTPTRELAIQVAEAFQAYGKHLDNFHVTPIYGGQNYDIQLRALKRGAQVIVGTPGRIMDHLRRKTLSLNNLKLLVLDEADEMLNMGFIDDVEWILEHTSGKHQTALFSATMPTAIQKVAERYQRNAVTVRVTTKETSISTIEQQYLILHNEQKLEVLTRLLEAEHVQAAIIFVRTKIESSKLADKLKSRGYATAALNGDISQSVRQKVITQIKNGSLDIIVATDVAARGIDVERVSHVINYDIPLDIESYTHRIGRTGRAGRSGKAILFVTPREGHLFKNIEKSLNTSITCIEPPSTEMIQQKQTEVLTQKMWLALQDKKLDTYRNLIEKIHQNTGLSYVDIAATLAYFNQNIQLSSSSELSLPEFSDEKRTKKRRSNSRPFRHESKRDQHIKSRKSRRNKPGKRSKR